MQLSVRNEKIQRVIPAVFWAGICGKSGEGMIMEAGNDLNAREGDIVTLDLEKKIHVNWREQLISIRYIH